ncbi:hypothetical protein [Streptomyces nojiriensis]|uniref:hypothetical protein n=1 Tax=Streptomyces nojiriensis TaxID=66374 RepID=UPI00365D732B
MLLGMLGSGIDIHRPAAAPAAAAGRVESADRPVPDPRAAVAYEEMNSATGNRIPFNAVYTDEQGRSVRSRRTVIRVPSTAGRRGTGRSCRGRVWARGAGRGEAASGLAFGHLVDTSAA